MSTRHRVRVLQTFTPDRGDISVNPYTTLLERSLRPYCEVHRFSWPRALAGRYDVLHCHWPEHLVGNPKWLRRTVAQVLLAALLVVLRVRRIAVVQTMHNVTPHTPPHRVSAVLPRALERRVGDRIYLHPASEVTGRAHVFPHGDYAEWYAEQPRLAPVPGRVAFVGRIHRYKNVEGLLRAFAGTSGGELVVAGSVQDARLEADIRALAAADDRVTLRLGPLTDAELCEVVTSASAVAVPYEYLYNSGALLLALTLGRPVIAPRSELADGMAGEVGAEWVATYDQPLDAAKLTAALAGLDATVRPARPTFTDRDWDAQGARLAGVYRAAIRPRERLVLVDDGLVSGGGQLGLGRYLAQPSERHRELVLLAPNRIGDAAPVPVHVLSHGSTRRTLPRAWLRLVLRHLRRADDTVVANSLMAAIVLAATPKHGRRFVYYMREDFSPGWITGIKHHVVKRLVFPRYDGFVANSAWTGSTLPLRRDVRVAYPLSGVPAGPLPGRAATTTPLRVLSLSRIAAWKGIDVVLDAATALARDVDVQLTIAGSVAPGEDGYARTLHGRDLPPRLRVEFTGHVEDVDALLASHDVLVIASRHPEPFGQVVVQALAWGLAVVASAHGGPVDVLAGEPLGRLVTPDDPAALAEALRELAENPPAADERRRTAEGARETYRDAALASAFERAVTESLS